MTRVEIDWLILQCMWKTKFLVKSFEGFFRTSFSRILHCIHIVRTSWNQLPVRFGIFCRLIEVVYWPSGLEFVYPMINLAYLGIIVKLSAKFCLHSLEWFCLQIRNDTKYFPLTCLRYCDQKLVVLIYYFQIWNKKGHIIIRGCPRCVMVKVMDCGIGVSEFEIQSRYYPIYPIYPTPPQGQDMTHGQFLSGV